MTKHLFCAVVLAGLFSGLEQNSKALTLGNGLPVLPIVFNSEGANHAGTAKLELHSNGGSTLPLPPPIPVVLPDVAAVVTAVTSPIAPVLADPIGLAKDIVSLAPKDPSPATASSAVPENGPSAGWLGLALVCLFGTYQCKRPAYPK